MTDDSLSVDSDTSRFSDLMDQETSCDSGKISTSDNVSLNNGLKLETSLKADIERTDSESLSRVEETDTVKQTENSGDSRTTFEADNTESVSEDSGKDNCAIDRDDASNSDTIDNYSAIATELAVGSEDLVNSSGTLKLPIKEGLTVPSLGFGVDKIVDDILKEGSDNSNGMFHFQ